MTVVYTYDWSGSNGASWDAAWTGSEVGGAGGTRDIQSNQGRTLTTATNFNTQRFILGSAQFSSADAEVLIDTATQAGVGQAQIYLRTSGDWNGTETDSASTCYKVLLNHSGNAIEFYKRLSGTTTQIGTTQSFTFASTTTYRNRFRIEGTTLSIRVWDTSGGEPGAWTYQQTDSAIATAGQFQLSFRTVSSAVRDLRWDNISIDDLAVAGAAPAVRPARRLFA